MATLKTGKRFRDVGYASELGPVDNAWLVCGKCGDIELHKFVEEETSPDGKTTGGRNVFVHAQMFACAKCGTVRQWGNITLRRRTLYLDPSREFPKGSPRARQLAALHWG